VSAETKRKLQEVCDVLVRAAFSKACRKLLAFTLGKQIALDKLSAVWALSSAAYQVLVYGAFGNFGQ